MELESIEVDWHASNWSNSKRRREVIVNNKFKFESVGSVELSDHRRLK